MPFNEKLNLNQFVPDENFDSRLDLIEIGLGDQKLYVRNINSIWGVPVSDPTISESMLENFNAHEENLPGSPGVRVDTAEIGGAALFGAANWDWRGIWRSQKAVTGFEVVRRTDLLRSTVIIEENR